MRFLWSRRRKVAAPAAPGELYPGIRVKAVDDCAPFFVAPGDTVRVTYRETLETGEMREQLVATFPIQHAFTCNRIVFIELEHALGVRRGLGAILGER